MSVVTLEDLQGSIEVVVFPRLYEQTGPIWQEGAILLVAGRVDHRGEEVSLLADVVVPWDEAVAKGPEAFGREVAAGDRGAPRRRQPVPVGPGPAGGTMPVAAGAIAGLGNGNGNGNGHGPGANGRGGPGGGPDLRSIGLGRRPDVAYVSPLRGGVIPEAGPLERPAPAGAPAATLPRITPAEPVSTYGEAPGDQNLVDRDVEPALPDEARSRAAAEASAATEPVAALAPGSAVHVRLGSVPGTQVVDAVKAMVQLVRERPGNTRVVLWVPGQGGKAEELKLPKLVAYDAELLGEVRRRLGDALVQLSVSPPAR